jgi:EF-P beta-lysylation protein EpmB
MITTQPLARHLPQPAGWQQELASAITDPAELLRRLELEPDLLRDALDASARLAAQGFPLRVPESYVRRMRLRDPADPLLLQVLPLGREMLRPPGFVADPLGEGAARRAPALLQKYAGRALLISTGACAVHCRYCFRREHDYGADAVLDEALSTIAADSRLEEIILSGGDPLVLGNRRLGALLERLRSLPHVRRIRIHTRTPIVLPSRVEPGLIATLAGPERSAGPALAIVLHANHAAEIDAEVATALRRLASCGAVLLNQSVLLRGVNDSGTALRTLSQALFAAGVLPYYLHLLDPVPGVAHYDVPLARARELMHELLASLPGYLVPRLVREQAGAPGKTWMDLGPGPSVAGLTSVTAP